MPRFFLDGYRSIGYIALMKKLLLEVIVMAMIVGTYGISLHSQTLVPPAKPTITIPVLAAQRDAIVTAQRDYALAIAQEQQQQQQESLRQQKALKSIQDLEEKITVAVTAARTSMKIDKDAPFDAITVSFTVPKK